jgi:hypothetical protein
MSLNALRSSVSITARRISGLSKEPSAEFQDRHGRGAREIQGLTVEEHINRLGQDLIPLAERCARVMREALANLETLRTAPSHVVERSRPISLSIRW